MLTWLPFLVMDVLSKAPRRPVDSYPASITAPSGPSDDPFDRSRSPHPCLAAATEPSGAPRGGCTGRCAFGSPASHPDRPRQACRQGVPWRSAMGLRLGRARLPGGLVGARHPGQGR
jgi:hypothetical protein